MEEAEIRKKYSELAEQYALPIFEKLEEDFAIDKILEKESVSFLLRDIRSVMHEKFSSYAHLFETLLNPSSSPMFIYSVLKSVSEDDKKMMKRNYSELAKLQFHALRLDTVYSEEDEAEFIMNSFETWQLMKHTIKELVVKFEGSFDEVEESKKRDYFG